VFKSFSLAGFVLGFYGWLCCISYMRLAEKEIVKKSELESVLHESLACRLGLCDESGVYIVPMNFGYCDGELFFHCAWEGRKVEMMKNNPSVCFECDVFDKIVERGVACSWMSMYRSVIGWGSVVFIEDESEKRSALRCLVKHYNPKAKDVFSKKNVDSVCVFKVVIEKMTGKKA